MDRKALIRQYKETRRPMGVYRVHNIRDDRSFIGANRDLQRDWAALGAGAFNLEVLDELSVPDRADYDPTDDLRVLESMWLDRLQPYDERGYHRRPRTA